MNAEGSEQTCHSNGADIPDDLRVKSIMILGGTVKVPEGFSHPDADPREDGTGQFMLSFGNTRVYKDYSQKEGEFELAEDGNGFTLSKDGIPLVGGVGLVKRYCHAPNQANVKLDPEVSNEDMLNDLKALVDTGTVRGISISLAKEVTLEDCTRSISKIRGSYLRIPIGLSYRPCTADDLVSLKDAGLDEFRLNVFSTVPRIFDYVNKGQDLQEVLRCLEEAVRIFGKGRVSTSLIAGLGETDEEIEGSMRDMAQRGVLSDIKYKRIKPEDMEQAEAELGTIPPMDPARFARFGARLKEIEAENGLDSNTFKTLCIACRGCNLVPFIDYRGHSRCSVKPQTRADGSTICPLFPRCRFRVASRPSCE